MTNYFVAYVAAFFLPLLFRSWRIAIVGLGLQGLILATILVATHFDWSIQFFFEFASLFFLRFLFLPWYIFRKMGDPVDSADFHLLTKNLLTKLIAFLLLVVAFIFGRKMAPNDSQEALQIGAAAGSILVAMLILSNQKNPIGQVVGLFMFEGGITLIELLSPHAMPFPVSVGATLVFVGLVLTCGQYLGQGMEIKPDFVGPAAKELE